MENELLASFWVTVPSRCSGNHAPALFVIAGLRARVLTCTCVKWNHGPNSVNPIFPGAGDPGSAAEINPCLAKRDGGASLNSAER